MPGGKTMMTMAELGFLDSSDDESEDNKTASGNSIISDDDSHTIMVASSSSNNENEGGMLAAASSSGGDEEEPKKLASKPDDRVMDTQIIPPTKKGAGVTNNNSNKRKAKRRNQASLKRFKTGPTDEATKSLIADTIFGGTDVVAIIFSFLDPRQLLRFVYISKEFKNLLTYEHIIRSTMLSGGFPLTNLERMVPPIRNRKIWIPSPIRLLRTLCGKRCERCDSQNRFVCYSFGLFWCKKCTNSSTKLFRRTKQWKDYLDAPRVSLGPQKASNGKSSMYLMLTPMKDAAGNPIGPLVTVQDLETMANDKNWSSKTPTEKVAAWMKKCDDQQPQSEAAVEAILKALEDNREDANRRATIREEKKQGRGKSGAARRKKSDELMANLMDLLKDEDSDITSIAKLDTKSWSENDNHYVFEGFSIADKVLGPVFKAPSKYYPNKKLQPVVDQLVLVTGEKKLMDMYIQQILDHCDHDPDPDFGVLRREYDTFSFRYNFSNSTIRDILQEPLSEPRTLTHETAQQLADQVKKIVHRRESGEEVFQKLEERLKGLPFVVDLWKREWHYWDWRWRSKESYINDILFDPLSKSGDITEEQLDELAQQLRTAMEKKKLVCERMQLLLAPIAKPYPKWHAKFEQWIWDSSRNLCYFSDFEARKIFGDDKELKHVEAMDDAKIGEFTNHLLTELKNDCPAPDPYEMM